MLYFYEPITYQILFGEYDEPAGQADVGEPMNLLTLPSNVLVMRP